VRVTAKAAPSGVVTFLFTDVEGSTRRWEADADAMRKALAAHDEVLRSAIHTHGGFMFKHTGDGVCAAFSSPKSAVDAALRAQLELQLPVRMGLATGEAELRDGDYFGAVLRLDGIPLAIELAASRMASMTASEVCDRLGKRFRLLVGSRRGLERHQTLRHAVAWSYDLLDDSEKALLGRCSVFAGGFDLESACAVAGSDDADDFAMLDLLDASVKNPRSASSRASVFLRARPLVSRASVRGSRCPAIRASIIARPDTPCRFDSTAETLIWASSSSFSIRCCSRVRSCTRARR
jgi:hypothetical protein